MMGWTCKGYRRSRKGFYSFYIKSFWLLTKPSCPFSSFNYILVFIAQNVVSWSPGNKDSQPQEWWWVQSQKEEWGPCLLSIGCAPSWTGTRDTRFPSQEMEMGLMKPMDCLRGVFLWQTFCMLLHMSSGINRTKYIISNVFHTVKAHQDCANKTKNLCSR